MKKTIVSPAPSLFLLILIASCGFHKQHRRVFIDDQKDSIVFDLTDYVLPASRIYLQDVRKSSGYYYLRFVEDFRCHFGGTRSFLTAVSETDHKVRSIPLPEGVHGFSGNPNPVEDLNNPLYEDADYTVRYVDHGEFGDVIWFIDNHSSEEYAFVGLSGSIRRVDNSLYIVNQTRIYELGDPSLGFHCDSVTSYENSKDIHLIAVHFHRAGYFVEEHNFLPVVHYDNEPAEIEKHALDDMIYYTGGFYVSEFAKTDTSIIGSFVASDTLYCALNTPSGLELAKLKDGHLIPVHNFMKHVGGTPGIRIAENYPAIVSVSTYCDDPNQQDDNSLLLLVVIEPGLYELYDIAHDGNDLLKLRFNPSGLKPVENDGYKELLSCYLNNWDSLTFERVLQEEMQVGGALSYQNLSADRNRFPPREIFSEKENYHIDVVTKQISDSFEVESEYWVKESDNRVPAVYMSWSRLNNLQSSFSAKEKYDEIVGIITNTVGQGTLAPKQKGKMQYMEWHSGQRCIRLYGDQYDVRFIMY